MSTEIIQEKKEVQTTKSLFMRDDVKAKFNEMLGRKAAGFMTSVLQIVASNALLAKADPSSVYQAAAVAATLDLPLNNNLGFAYIVPYNQKQPDNSYKQVAQFQLGYKGFIQLAQRSGQFKTISATPIYTGQLVESNPLTGFVFDFKKKENDNVIGFAAYFSLINGFEKTLYMTVEEMKAHGLKFSKTFSNSNSLWSKDFIGMGNKTVIKLLLSKFAPLSIEMQKAVLADQAIIKNEETMDVSYADNEDVIIDKEAERITLMIKDAKTVEQLEKLASEVDLSPEQIELFDARKAELKPKKS